MVVVGKCEEVITFVQRTWSKYFYSEIIIFGIVLIFSVIESEICFDNVK